MSLRASRAKPSTQRSRRAQNCTYVATNEDAQDAALELARCAAGHPRPHCPNHSEDKSTIEGLHARRRPDRRTPGAGGQLHFSEDRRWDRCDQRRCVPPGPGEGKAVRGHCGGRRRRQEPPGHGRGHPEPGNGRRPRVVRQIRRHVRQIQRRGPPAHQGRRYARGVPRRLHFIQTRRLQE